MKIRYWTITMSPSPTLLHRFGVGIVGENTETGMFAYRLIKNSELPRNSYIMGERGTTVAMLNMLRDALDGLQRTPQSGLDFENHYDLSTHMELLTDHWNNALNIDPARYMASKLSLTSAIDHLFKLFISDDSPPRQQRLTKLRTQIRAAYSNNEIINRNLIPKPPVTFGPLQGEPDLAVIKDHTAFELNSALSFSGTQPRRLLDHALAWNFKVQNLRDKGGLITNGDKTIKLSPDTPVVAVVIPPQSKEQKEVHEQATALWHELAVTEISENIIEFHTASLAGKLAA